MFSDFRSFLDGSLWHVLFELICEYFGVIFSVILCVFKARLI